MSDDGEPVQRYALADGEAIVVGTVHEEIDAFTIGLLGTTRPLSLDQRASAASAAKRLSRANGRFVAVVVRPARGATDPVATVVADWLPVRTLYYGRNDGRVVVSTSPQLVSDRLGFERALNPDRLVEICLYRNLVDDQTLFLGVQRLYNDEMLVLGPGTCERRPVDRAQFEMPDVPVGRPDDPLCVTLSREMVKRAVALRVAAHRDGPITLLLSAGRDSRVLLALAHELGVSDLVGVCVGTREGFNEAEVAVPFARRLGYRCEAVLEEDVDLRGFLEPHVVDCGYPPKFYNHLTLAAAVTRLGRRGGLLWTGDTAFTYSAKIFSQTLALRGRLRWLPPGFWRLFLPLHPLFRGRSRYAAWLLALDARQALAVSLCPERSLEAAREALKLFGRRAEPLDPAPLLLPGMSATLDRYARLDQRIWYWADHATVWPSGFRSRSLLAASIGARLDYPFKDNVLFAYVNGLYRRLPPHLAYSQWFKDQAYQPWLPRAEWHPKKGLVGRLARWFAEPRKLGDYRDVVASRECLERGIFDAGVVRSLLARSDRLSTGEAGLLWTVLTLELLFRTRTLRPAPPRSGLGASGAPTLEAAPD